MTLVLQSDLHFCQANICIQMKRSELIRRPVVGSSPAIRTETVLPQWTGTCTKCDTVISPMKWNKYVLNVV